MESVKLQNIICRVTPLVLSLLYLSHIWWRVCAWMGRCWNRCDCSANNDVCLLPAKCLFPVVTEWQQLQQVYMIQSSSLSRLIFVLLCLQAQTSPSISSWATWVLTLCTTCCLEPPTTWKWSLSTPAAWANRSRGREQHVRAVTVWKDKRRRRIVSYSIDQADSFALVMLLLRFWDPHGWCVCRPNTARFEGFSFVAEFSELKLRLETWT